MKREITGYITALINIKKSSIKMIKEQNYNINTKASENAIEELTCLLTFVEGIKEEQVIPIINCYLEEATLGIKRIKELEETCQNLLKINKDLHKRIEQLENEIIASEIISNKRKKEIVYFNKNNWSK